MPDPTYSDALKEALASAPADVSIISTLSIYYEGLVDSMSQPTEIYVYLGWAGDRENAEGVPLKDFRIEAGATRNGGAVVEFISMPFSATLPDVNNNTTSKGKLAIDGVGREVADALLAAVALGKSVDVTYREYLEGMELDGPQNDPPIRFNLENITITVSQVTGDIGVGSVGNRKFPAELYTAEEFPSLYT